MYTSISLLFALFTSGLFLGIVIRGKKKVIKEEIQLDINFGEYDFLHDNDVEYYIHANKYDNIWSISLDYNVDDLEITKKIQAKTFVELMEKTKEWYYNDFKKDGK